MATVSSIVYQNSKYEGMVFTCRGVCMDTFYNPGVKINPNQVFAIPFHYESTDIANIDTVYGVYDIARHRFLAFYDNKEIAAGIAANTGKGCTIKQAELITETIQDPGQPFHVNIHSDKSGRLFTKINAHPSYDGKYSNGKTYFQDRSWKDAAEGPARVRIMKEKDTYGFITGKMLKFDQGGPTWKEFLEFVQRPENEEWLTYHAALINHPVRGNYIALLYYGDWQYVTRKHGAILHISNSMVERDISDRRYIEKDSKKIIYHLVENHFGVPYHEIYCSYTPCKFLDDAYYRTRLVGSHWVKVNDPISQYECIEQAIEQGIFTVYNLYGTDVHALLLMPAGDKELLQYNHLIDVAEMFQIAGDINTKAKEKIGELIKKGKIRFQGISV